MVPVYHPATKVIYSSKVGEAVVEAIMGKDKIGLRRIDCGGELTAEES